MRAALQDAPSSPVPRKLPPFRKHNEKKKIKGRRKNPGETTEFSRWLLFGKQQYKHVNKNRHRLQGWPLIQSTLNLATLPWAGDEGEPSPETSRSCSPPRPLSWKDQRLNICYYQTYVQSWNVWTLLPPSSLWVKKKSLSCKPVKKKKNCFQLTETEMVCWTMNWNIILEITSWLWHKVLYLQLGSITVIYFNL